MNEPPSEFPPPAIFSVPPGSTIMPPAPPPSAAVVLARRVPDVAAIAMLAWWGARGVVTPHEAWGMALAVLAFRIRPATPGALSRFFVR